MNFKFCPDCGTNIENQSEFKFCSNCGTSLLVTETVLKNDSEQKNIYINVESEEKSKAKSGAKSLLAYPMILILIVFSPLIPIVYSLHDILRYKKFGWKKEEGFSWKKKIWYHIIFNIVCLSIFIYLFYGRHEVAYLFFALFLLMFYLIFAMMKEPKEN